MNTIEERARYVAAKIRAIVKDTEDHAGENYSEVAHVTLGVFADLLDPPEQDSDG